MKKLLVSVIAAAGLAGCTYYDYYKGDVRYTQDGKDCIYRADEYARHFSPDIKGIDDSKRIVYRNTRCEDLFGRDNPSRVTRNERQFLAPVAEPVKVAEPIVKTTRVVNSCPCNADIVTRRYYTIID